MRGGGHAPVRCTVQATLMKPEYKVEIKIIAAVSRLFFIFILKARHDPLGMGGAKFFRDREIARPLLIPPGHQLLNTFNGFLLLVMAERR